MSEIDFGKPLSRKEVAELCGCAPTDIPTEGKYSLRQFIPPGPVCQSYILSEGPIDGIMGPGGSGKTIGSFFKGLRLSVGRMPATKGGTVKARGTIVRDNYRSLYRTTLRSWFSFFPPDFLGSTFTGGADRPAQHRLRLSTVRRVNGVAREVPVDLELDFFAIGDIAIEDLLKSYETSWGYANEADQLGIRTIPFLYSRTGRYPSLDELPPGAVRPRMVCFDMNPPKPNHPLLKAAQRGTFKDPSINADSDAVKEETDARAINFFQQPSGLSDKAENRRGKTREEYEQDLLVLSEEDGRRMVHGLPGYSSDGKPVYAREFNRRKHVADGPLKVLPGVPLAIGFDQGLSPSAVLAQVSSHGQLRILREIWLGHSVGYERFLQALIPVLQSPPFKGLPPGPYTSDPAGFYGADKISGLLSWSDTIAAGLGRPIYPAPTNEPMARWEAVRLRLLHDIDANTPGMIIDPGCQMLIEGFEAEYKHPKFKENAPRTYGDNVVDNDFTNPHDALQYLVLGVFGRAGVINEAARAGRAGNIVPIRGGQAGAPGSFSVWDV